MISMSNIWDRTTEVIRGRGAMLATIVALLYFLPTIVQNALLQFGLGRSPALAILFPLIGLAATVLTLWNSLSLVAASSDPSIVTAADAIGRARGRLGALLGISLLAGLAAIMLMIPAFAIGARAVDLAAMRASPGSPLAWLTPRSSSALAGLGAYVIALMVIAIWLGARLMVLTPVILHERRGLGCFGRAFALTRGLTLRLIGIELLFLLVFAVAWFAVQAVFGVVARLALGPDQLRTAAFVAQVAVAAVTAAYIVVATTFSAQLYRAVTGAEAARAFA